MSVSVATLTTLRDRVEQLLLDTGNDIWVTGAIDEAIDSALSAYSEVRPQVVKTSLALTSILSTNGREIDISAVTGLVSVVEVWAPYLAADDKATRRRFEHWLEQEVVNLADGTKVSASDTARIVYAKAHTLNGLNSAVATTFVTGAGSLIVVGAAGYACTSRSVDLLEQVTLGRRTVERLIDIGQDYLADFFWPPGRSCVMLSLLCPVGFILLWPVSGPSIPDSWVLCDGLNGTSDLRADVEMDSRGYSLVYIMRMA